MIITINNNDTGSLKVGAAGAHLAIGDKVQIVGESFLRTVTYKMGNGDRTHLCFKSGVGSNPKGALPMGTIEVDIAPDNIPVPTDTVKDALSKLSPEQLQQLLATLTPAPVEAAE